MEEAQRRTKIANGISDLLSDCFSWIKSQVERLYKLACENLPVFWENCKLFLVKFIRKLKEVFIMINNFLDRGMGGRGTTTEVTTPEDQETVVVESTDANEKMSLKELGNDCIIIVKESAKLLAKVALVVGCVKEWKHTELNKSLELMGGIFDLAEQTMKTPLESFVGVVVEIANYKKEKGNSVSSSRVSMLQGNGALVVRQMLSLKVTLPDL